MVCILISGIPASGKSYFSEYLSCYLDVPSISKDNIKEILFDTIGFSSREEKIHLDDAATLSMLYCAECFMKHNKVFIMESNFDKKSKPQLVELINQYNYKSITVSLTGEYTTIYKRLILRNKSSERHPGHIVNDYYPREVVEKDYDAISFENFVDEIEKREMDAFCVGDICLRIDTTRIKEVNWESVANVVKNDVSSYLSNSKVNRQNEKNR